MTENTTTRNAEPGADGRLRRFARSSPKKLRGAAGELRSRFARRRSTEGETTSTEGDKAGTPAGAGSARALGDRRGTSTADE
ncbi:MAG: hypothetical protein ACLGI5_01325 [Thermoleophilia bacterium]